MRRPFYVFVSTLWTLLVSCHGSSNSTMKIMTLNIYVGGGGEPLEQTAAVIQAAGANVVGLQESPRAISEALAELLGWQFVLQHGGDVALISSWEIVGSLTNPQLGGKIRYNNTNTFLYVINLHLDYCPYEPYQLLDIPYCCAPYLKKTEEAAIASARASRGDTVEVIRSEVDTIRSNTDNPLIFILGDFNEPSHRDWTEQAAQAGRHPIKVAWPTTAVLENELSFQDAYRFIRPDEMEHPGYTWTPTTSVDDPHDHHDRIDYVLYYNPNRSEPSIQTTSVEILGPDSAYSDVVVNPYPSDHRSVVATFVF
jgi:exodeoxyribonuclease III